MKIMLFVNDSYFSYLLSRPVIALFHKQITAVVFSTKNKESMGNILNIYQRTHWRYFLYRFMIELLNRFNTLRKQNSVRALAIHYDLRLISTTNIAKCQELQTILPADLGLAFNFDQIFRRPLLCAFTHGVLNVHASHLPRDKGISPVLWAFARGDQSVWSTIYRMDEGIDSGPIFRQFEIPVKSADTACSLYMRVCNHSGLELKNVVRGLMQGRECPQPQKVDREAVVWSWPNHRHREMMVGSKRAFMDLFDMGRIVGHEWPRMRPIRIYRPQKLFHKSGS